MPKFQCNDLVRILYSGIDNTYPYKGRLARVIQIDNTKTPILVELLGSHGLMTIWFREMDLRFPCHLQLRINQFGTEAPCQSCSHQLSCLADEELKTVHELSDRRSRSRH